MLVLFVDLSSWSPVKKVFQDVGCEVFLGIVGYTGCKSLGYLVDNLNRLCLGKTGYCCLG